MQFAANAGDRNRPHVVLPLVLIYIHDLSAIFAPCRGNPATGDLLPQAGARKGLDIDSAAVPSGSLVQDPTSVRSEHGGPDVFAGLHQRLDLLRSSRPFDPRRE